MSLLLSKGFLIGTLATLGLGGASYGGYVVYTHVIKGNTSVDTNTPVVANSCLKKSTRSLITLLSTDNKDNSCSDTTGVSKPSADAQGASTATNTNSAPTGTGVDPSSGSSQDTAGKGSSDQTQTHTPTPATSPDVQNGKQTQPSVQQVPSAPPAQAGNSQDTGASAPVTVSTPGQQDTTATGTQQGVDNQSQP